MTAQNQLEKVRYNVGYLASYLAGHPAGRSAEHLIGCPALGHLVKCCSRQVGYVSVMTSR